MGMNDGAIELSAASWQRRAGSADKGAVITDKKFTAFVPLQMKVMITRLGSGAG